MATNSRPTSTSVGLYGGSFDPIHFGHLISARSVAEQLGLDRIVLIPSARPPHKLGGVKTAPEHRLAMAKLAVEGDPLFEVSDTELHREGPSYTFDTVRQFRQSLGDDADIYWLIGGDTLPELPTWYRVRELVQCVRIVTATRPSWSPPAVSVLEPAVGPDAARALLNDCIVTPGIDISATDIRARVQDGRCTRYLLPDTVRSYIERNRLYRS